MKNNLVLSPLGHTWLLDLDGTIVTHNGYLIQGHDTLLESAKGFLDSIPAGDTVIILTSRKEEYREQTLAFLAEHNIRFDHIVFGLPYGERILVNDKKPSGLSMSVSVNLERDKGDFPAVSIDDNL